MKLAITAICVGLLSAPVASATTYVVRPDGTGDYATIQAAIDAAVNGDEIVLGDGVFRGDGNRDLDCPWQITIRSEHEDPERCVIDCEGSPEEPHRGIIIGGQAVLCGITVTHGYAHLDGGAVFLRTATLRDCIFRDNRAERWGGAVMCDESYYSVVDRCTMIGNSAPLGGGVFI
jgi:hypothetical protein